MIIQIYVRVSRVTGSVSIPSVQMVSSIHCVLCLNLLWKKTKGGVDVGDGKVLVLYRFY